MQKEIERYRATLHERIRWLHSYVKGMSALPESIEQSVRGNPLLTPLEREGVLRLFFITAQNWQRWEYYGNMRSGMAFITGAIDMEYTDITYAHDTLLFHLPTLTAPMGRDWRKGTFNLLGEDVDECPIDVPWTDDQIAALEDGDSAVV